MEPPGSGERLKQDDVGVVKHLSWIVTIPVTIVVLVFALANRAKVELHFWPFPWTKALPLFVVVLGCLFVGIVLGFVIAWLSGAPRRRRARQTADRARELARQLAELQRARAASPPSAGQAASPAPAAGRALPAGGHAAAEPAASLERLPGA